VNATLPGSKRLDPTKFPGRVAKEVAIFSDDAHLELELCPECPRSMTIYLDESPYVTAERLCSSFPESIVSRAEGMCTEIVSKRVADQHLSLFLELGMELDDHLENEGVDMLFVEGKR
jgi:hypothetical protein